MKNINENIPSPRFYRCGRPLSENQRKRKDRKILEPCSRTKKVVEHKGKGNTDFSWCVWNGSQRLEGIGRFGNQSKILYHPDSIVEVGQNTKMNPGDQKKLAVTQTLVKDFWSSFLDFEVNIRF